MIIYISGPMTGLPDLNFPEFHNAERLLREKGYDVLNPARHGSGEEWQYYMRAAMRDVADADGIAVLGNWKSSKGAQLEVHVANALGMQVKILSWWLSQ